MNISEEYFKLINNELKEVKKLCNEAKTLEDKLYFFSASFGVLNRVMNFSCEPILVFMHNVLQDAHKKLSQRRAIPQKPGVICESLPKEIIDSFFSYFYKLINEFSNKDENKIRKVLEKISYISYTTTGNGFYLYLSGKLDL